MKNLKTILYIIVLSTFFLVDNSFWNFWLDDINDDLVWSKDNIDIVVQKWLAILLWFLAILAVIVGILWWFKILTAWEDDEKVQSWKKIITYVIIWIIIIFSAWLIVNFIVWSDKEDWILYYEEE